MINDVKLPPVEPAEPAVEPNSPTRPGAHRPAPTLAGVKPHAGIAPHIDPKEPGTHHARIMGERGATDVIYDMPMEDRGSTFSIGLTITVFVLVVAAVLYVAYSLFR